MTPIGASRSALTDYDQPMASHSHELAAGATDAAAERTATVLVYSSHAATRAQVMNALGRSPAPGLTLTYVEIGAGREVVSRLDEGGIDLVILDGEAAPTGGMGLARQLKDELDSPPPVLLLVGRRDDAWLATWSRAESVIAHPLDAVQVAAAAMSLLVGAGPVAAAH
jgi:DNA-binding response OmpR family regulator